MTRTAASRRRFPAANAAPINAEALSDLDRLKVEVPVPAKLAPAGAAAPTLPDYLGVSWGIDLAPEYRTLFMQGSISAH